MGGKEYDNNNARRKGITVIWNQEGGRLQEVKKNMNM
jgi:hypothetical protein